MRTVRGHFDGKVVVLDEPASFLPNEAVTVTSANGSAETEHGTVEYFLKHMSEPIDDQSAEEMRRAVEEAFGQVEAERDVNL
jgi:hypothetical protein